MRFHKYHGAGNDFLIHVLGQDGEIVLHDVRVERLAVPLQRDLHRFSRVIRPALAQVHGVLHLVHLIYL